MAGNGKEQLYRDYINSPQWRARRLRALDLAGNRCEYWTGDEPGSRCAEVKRLQVHHRTYTRLGCEADDDLEVLCWFHHMVEHMTWRHCRCGDPVVTHGEAEAFVAGVLRRRRVDLATARPEDLPSKPYLESLLPRSCSECRSRGRSLYA